jgi:ABC-type transport system involved in multi-copper enzyme maturation permease subunit
MNLLLKKEVRLLLPSAATVLALAIVTPWLGRSPYSLFAITTTVLFFGLLLMATSSFGREISAGTFSSMLAQPVERRRIWRVKIGLLALAAALIFAVCFASCFLRIHDYWADVPGNTGALYLKNNFAKAAGTGALFALMALSGGLWTTLLLRHAIASFWVAFMVPAGVIVLELLVDAQLVSVLSAIVGESSNMPGQDPARTVIYCGMIALGVAYGIAGIVFSWRLFLRAEDAARFGDLFSLSRERAPDDAAPAKKTSRCVRAWKPVRALLKKEFQLHTVSFLFVGAFLILHVLAILLRSDETLLNGFPVLQSVVQFFWIFWLIVPLIIGCMVVAEERKFGVLESQFCLPVTRCGQFVLKILPTLAFGIIVGSVLPLALEIAAGSIGVSGRFSDIDIKNELTSWDFIEFFIKYVGAAAGLALVGIWGSTLAKNFLQATSIAIAGAGACVGIGTLITGKYMFRLFGLGLPILAVIAAAVVFPWLAWRNYKFFAESERVWRRNALAFGGALLFMFAGSTAFYHRAWEVFLRAEPAHGAAKLSLENPPKLLGNVRGTLNIVLPDGRVWADTFGEKYTYNPRVRGFDALWRNPFGSLPASQGPQIFPADSDLASTNKKMDAIALDLIRERKLERFAPASFAGSIYATQWQGYIGNDGSLWIGNRFDLLKTDSAEAKYLQVGTETDWLGVVTLLQQMIALKADGSLWQWNFSYKVETLEEKAKVTPTRLGIHNDWVGVTGVQFRAVALAADGSLWMWPQFYDHGPLMKKPRKQPKRLGNIFDAAR